MQQTERPLRESLLISSERAASILLHLFATRVSLRHARKLSIGNCTQRRNGTSSEHSTLTLGVR